MNYLKNRSLFTLILGFMLMLESSFAQAPAAKGIDFFHGSFAELKAKAASEKKPIFMDAYTSWCGPCKWMSKTVFTDESVGKFYNEKFVCAKVDMEDGEGIELAKLFSVNAYPTLLYLNPDGKIIHQALGARPAAEFINLGKEATDPERNLMGLQAKFAGAPSSFIMAYPYFSFLNEAGLPQLQTELARWFEAKPKEQWAERENWQMLFEFSENPRSPEIQHLVFNRKKFEEKYGADSVEQKLRKVLFMSLQRNAYAGEMENWRSDSTNIRNLNLKDGPRVISSSTINMAKDDNNLALKRIMEHMEKFPSDNPDELNQYAWRMFEVSEDPRQLAAAEGWAKKGLELSKGDYMIHDTYASLLFKNKKFALARTEAMKAMETGKGSGQDVSGTEELLKKIDAALKPGGASKPVVKSKNPGGKKK